MFNKTPWKITHIEKSINSISNIISFCSDPTRNISGQNARPTFKKRQVSLQNLFKYINSQFMDPTQRRLPQKRLLQVSGHQPCQYKNTQNQSFVSQLGYTQLRYWWRQSSNFWDGFGERIDRNKATEPAGENGLVLGQNIRFDWKERRGFGGTEGFKRGFTC